MKIELTFQGFARSDYSIQDTLDDLVNGLDPTLPHVIGDPSTIFMPVAFEDLVQARKNGLQIIEKDDRWYYIIREIRVTFYGFDVEDYENYRDHIIDTCGSKAVAIECKDRKLIGEPV